jgi:hypothetical protein
MKDLLCEVKDLMMTGNINKELTHKFNGIQADEEVEKKQKKHEIDIETLHRFEDHPLIYGYVAGLGYDHLDLADTFLSLFGSNPEFVKIHRAMLAIGDYTQNDSSRYYMGNHNRATWSQLLHKSRNRSNFEEKRCLFFAAFFNELRMERPWMQLLTNTFLKEKKRMNSIGVITL